MQGMWVWSLIGQLSPSYSALQPLSPSTAELKCCSWRRPGVRNKAPAHLRGPSAAKTRVCVCVYAPKYAQLKKLSPRLQRYVTTETGCYSQGNYYTWAPKVLEQSLSYHIPEKKLFTNVSSYLASPLFGAFNLIKCCWEDCCYLVPKSDSSETPWTVVHQAPLSMGFPRQEYWSGFAGKIYPVKKTK